MRCRLHPCASDRPGVCASCLRERLDALVAERKRHGSSPSSSYSPSAVSPERPSSSTEIATTSCQEFPDPFQRPVSPYVRDRDSLFFSTPQFNPKAKKKSNKIHSKNPNHISDPDCISAKEKRRFSFCSALFLRQEKPVEGHASHARLPQSSRWFSTFLPVRHKKSRLFPSVVARASIRPSDRGMSPADDDDESADEGGYFSDTLGTRRSPESATKTPTKTTAMTFPTVRQWTGQHNPSGFSFCLSPLMRPSPGRPCREQFSRNRPLLSGENRVYHSGKHLPGDPNSFRNQSRKFTGFGKCP